jgi:hypothetical protein
VARRRTQKYRKNKEDIMATLNDVIRELRPTTPSEIEGTEIELAMLVFNSKRGSPVIRFDVKDRHQMRDMLQRNWRDDCEPREVIIKRKGENFLDIIGVYPYTLDFFTHTEIKERFC